MAERWDEPAALDTMQVYSPAWLAFTDSIDNCLERFPDFEIIMSSRLESTGSPLNIQTISRGMSPFIAAHETDGISPALAGSSPNEKWAICGATENE